jgi:O-methyltransferase involved in polyketide biosynthesis
VSVGIARCEFPLTLSAVAIDHTLRRFLEAFPEGQIISLGAGFDTAYFRLHAAGLPFRAFYEVDFPALVARKAAIIARTPLLGDHLEAPPTAAAVVPGEVHTARYHVLGCDLQDIAGLQRRLQQAGADFALPTLVLSECVLTYVPCGLATEVPVAIEATLTRSWSHGRRAR